MMFQHLQQPNLTSLDLKVNDLPQTKKEVIMMKFIFYPTTHWVDRHNFNKLYRILKLILLLLKILKKLLDLFSGTFLK